MEEQFAYWHFIEKYHPNFSSDDRVLMADIMFRYLDGDTVYEEDMDWLESMGTKHDVLQELIDLETKLFAEALESLYKRILFRADKLDLYYTK